MAIQTKGRDHGGRFERPIKTAQAKAALDGLYLSLLANSLIALSMATLLWREKEDWRIGWWLAGIVALNALRFAIAYFVRKHNGAELQPRLVLDFTAVGALLSGIGWSIVPLFLSNISQNGNDSYVVFIIAGISAGALIQNTAFALGALCFLLPPLASLDFIMLFSGSLTGVIVGANAVLLTYMMARSSIAAQDQFYERTMRALEATELADSLARANRQIVQSNERLGILANTDGLTGLANRACFNKVLSERLEALPFNGEEIALVIFDIDRFKTINDTLGHKAGDELLKEFARRLTAEAGPGDLVARLGGDEFAAILSGTGALSRATALAEKIVEGFKAPLTINGTKTHSGSSAGIAVAPAHAQDADTVFTCADLALYAAKESGRNCANVFDESLKDQLVRKRIIESSLANALHDNVLQAYFQPQISLKTGKVMGFESLLRWQHADLGEVKPSEVTEAAVNCNIAEQITSFMLTKACEFLASFDAGERDRLTLAVNISPRELTNQSPTEEFLAIVRRFGISPESIEIEITEETFFEAKSSNDKLQALKNAGFKIAIDDFGMGHSSLSYLIDMKIDRLKIDRGFITGIAENPNNQALVSALLNVGTALGIDILAEGVETQDDARTVVDLGGDYIQGFLFAPAMPADEAARWLTEHQRAYRELLIEP